MHFNGVDLPPGTIVVELSDGGWVAGRLSAFSLDDEHGAALENAQRVMGPQMEEAMSSDGFIKSLQFVGIQSKLSA